MSFAKIENGTNLKRPTTIYMYNALTPPSKMEFSAQVLASTHQKQRMHDKNLQVIKLLSCSELLIKKSTFLEKATPS